MLKFFSAKRYNMIDVLYQYARGEGFVHGRKVAIVSGLKILGYHEDVLIYPRAQIARVSKSYTPVEGWIVNETVRNPKDKKSGYVVCKKVAE